ncbi:hypothetical protein D1Z90_19420 [Motilimonas pumila]|uniref:Uncharacterized protein n=1 Tax=Motilimonas pumila TaxID=2303987 RepID=A0A418Y9N9_9GAMM|nr:hypothetical protein D1Z90_19420 [Motilimonas pumila]
MGFQALQKMTQADDIVNEPEELRKKWVFGHYKRFPKPTTLLSSEKYRVKNGLSCTTKDDPSRRHSY